MECKPLASLRKPIDGTYIRKTLSATREWALVRLVASMGTAVDSQGAALNECLVARFVVTSVRALVGVYSIMALEIRLSIETLCDAIVISLWTCTTEAERWAQNDLPWGSPDAIRTEKGERPCRQRRVQL